MLVYFFVLLGMKFYIVKSKIKFGREVRTKTNNETEIYLKMMVLRTVILPCLEIQHVGI